jgi:hypothetical protein
VAHVRAIGTCRFTCQTARRHTFASSRREAPEFCVD